MVAFTVDLWGSSGSPTGALDSWGIVLVDAGVTYTQIGPSCEYRYHALQLTSGSEAKMLTSGRQHPPRRPLNHARSLLRRGGSRVLRRWRPLRDGRFPHSLRSSRPQAPIALSRRAARATARQGPARSVSAASSAWRATTYASRSSLACRGNPLYVRTISRRSFSMCFRVSRTTSACGTPPISRVSRDDATACNIHLSSGVPAHRDFPSIFLPLRDNAKHVHGPPYSTEIQHSVSANSESARSAQVDTVNGNHIPSDSTAFGESSQGFRLVLQRAHGFFDCRS